MVKTGFPLTRVLRPKRALLSALMVLVAASLGCSALGPDLEKAGQEADHRNTAVGKAPAAAGTFLAAIPAHWKEEVLLGLSAEGRQLAVRVRTGGCTGKENFHVLCRREAGSNQGPPHYLLTVYRVRRDPCKAFHPGGTWITFHLDRELGLPILFSYSVTNRVEGTLQGGRP